MNVEEYKSANDGKIGERQFYSKLPVEIRNEDIFNGIIKASRYSDMNITVKDENIFFYYADSIMNLEKGTMKPISYYYKDNKYNEFLTTYFKIELDCVEELKI